MNRLSAARIALLLFAGFPAAADWKPVADDKKTRVEIDVASLVRGDDTVKAWERETHFKPEQARPGDFFYSSVKTLAQHHCVDRTTTYLYRAYFAVDGSEIKALTASTDLNKVDFLVPGSLEERKLIFACTYKPAAKKPAAAPPLSEPTEKAPKPPASVAKPTPDQPAEKIPPKNTPPAKSAAKNGKSPVEGKPEIMEKAQPKATVQPAKVSPEKTPPGK